METNYGIYGVIFAKCREGKGKSIWSTEVLAKYMSEFPQKVTK